MAPIDIVEAESEVARNEERSSSRRRPSSRRKISLRALIFDPAAPDFWTVRSSRPRRRRFAPRRSTSRPPCERRSTTGPICESRRTTWRATDVNIRYYRNQALPDVNAAAHLQHVGGGRRAAEPVDPHSASVPVDAHDHRAAQLTDRCSATSSPAQFPAWTVGVSGRLPARHQPVGGEPRAGAAPASAGADAAQEPRAAGGDPGARRRAAGADEPEARRDHPRRARARGAAARSRGEEVRRRHPDELLRVPGAARPGAGADATKSGPSADYNKSLVDFEAVQEAPLRAAVDPVAGSRRRSRRLRRDSAAS